MNNIPNKKPAPSEKENLQFFDGLFKSVAGLVGIVMLVVGVVLLVVFQSEISAWSDTDKSAVAEIPVESSNQILDGKDVETGLIAGEGLELVKGSCTSCHSSALILQNRFTREGWQAKIIWMQETQGLWDLGATEPKILDYLAANYAPEAPKGRRIPLADIEWYDLKD